MSRGVSSSISTGAAEKVTRPVYLVSVAWSSGTKYYSSRGDITFDSVTYSSTDVKVSIQPDKNSATIIFGNADLAAGKLVLYQGVYYSDTEPYIDSSSYYSVKNGVIDIAIVIKALYGAGPWVAGDEEILFSGVGDGASITEKTMKIKAVSIAVHSWAPRLAVIKENGFNFLPPPIMDIMWQGDRYRLTKGR